MFKLLVIRFIVKLYFRAEIDFQKQKIYFQYQPKARFLPQDKHTRIHTSSSVPWYVTNMWVLTRYNSDQAKLLLALRCFFQKKKVTMVLCFRTENIIFGVPS